MVASQEHQPADRRVEQETKFELVIQPQDREGLGADHPADAFTSGGAGDRLVMLDQRGQLLVAALGFASLDGSYASLDIARESRRTSWRMVLSIGPKEEAR